MVSGPNPDRDGLPTGQLRSEALMPELLYSMAEFLPLLRRILPAGKAWSMVEIGAEAGTMTRELVALLKAGALRELTIVEPAPGDILEAVRDHPGVRVVATTSAEALPGLDLADLYLIDGDHNYFSVERDTAYLLERCEADKRWAILCFHDVCWPWDRRDLYYAPERVPSEHRHEHSHTLGVTPQHDALIPFGFRNAGAMAIATHRGGPKNGVRTAIEDVLARHPNWELHVIPVVFGLGVVLPRSHPEYGRVTAAIAPYVDHPLLERLERNRMNLFVRVQELEDEKEAARLAAGEPPGIPVAQPAAGPLSPPAEDRNLQHIARALEKSPRSWRVLSLELYDTLLTRFSLEDHEDEFEIARRLQARRNLVNVFVPEEFAAMRRAAEERARARKRGGTPSLFEIYLELSSVLRDPAAAARVEHEVRTERLRLDPAVAHLVRHARSLGLRTAVLEEIPLGAQEVRALLAATGLEPQEIDWILTSSEENAHMEDGGLFRVLLERFGLSPHEVVHLGARPLAGLAGAARVGIQGFQRTRTTSFLSEALSGQNAGDCPRLVEALRVVARGVPLNDRNINPIHPEIAFLLGPALARFADWVVQEMAAAGVRRLLALTSDGPLCAELCRRASEAARIPVQVLPCATSRQATTLASLGTPAPASLRPLLEAQAHLTIGEVLERLGLRPEEMLLGTQELGVRLHSPLVRAALLRHLSQGALSGLIEARSAERRLEVLAYFEPLLGSDTKVGLVDLAWGGDMQRNLERILDLAGKPTEIVGRYFAPEPRTLDPVQGDGERSYLDQLGGESFLLAPIWRTPLSDEVDPCPGWPLAYRVSPEGKVEPVVGPPRATGEKRVLRARLQTGLLAFQEIWLASRGNGHRLSSAWPGSPPDEAPRKSAAAGPLLTDPARVS
jgi:FMN phosphatase YigB (HAD superfamily)